MLRTVGAAASMSAMLGRAGIRHRLATWIAAVAAGVSTPGVSMITSWTPCFLEETHGSVELTTWRALTSGPPVPSRRSYQFLQCPAGQGR